MTPSPILKVLFTLTRSGVRSLLMGGQACVLYGAAEFSRDTDIVVPADDAATIAADLRAEEETERDADRRYWAPLRRELEQMRFDRRTTG